MIKEIHTKRLLLEATIYRKYAFENDACLREWLDKKQTRWLVSYEQTDNVVIAVVGELYNGTKELKMEEVKK